MKISSRTQVVFLLLMIALLFSSCFMDRGIKGDGKYVKQEYSVSDFSRISVGGAYNVMLTQGGSESLVIEAEENLMEYIKVEVIGDKLSISNKESLSPTKEMMVYLSFKDLSRIGMSGACNLTNKGELSLSELAIIGSGASDINLNMELDELDIISSGASEIYLAGKANELDIEVSGASDIRAFDFEVDECDIELSGAGNVEVFVNKELDVSVSGAGSCYYKGNPKVSQSVSGVGSVKMR